MKATFYYPPAGKVPVGELLTNVKVEFNRTTVLIFAATDAGRVTFVDGHKALEKGSAVRSMQARPRVAARTG